MNKFFTYLIIFLLSHHWSFGQDYKEFRETNNSKESLRIAERLMNKEKLMLQ